MIQFFKDIFNGFKNANKKRKVLYSILILLYLVALALVSIKINVEAITPGGITADIGLSSQKGENLALFIDTNNSPGKVFTVGVHSHKKISLFQYLISLSNNDIDHIEFDPKTDLSKLQDYQIGKKSKDNSLKNALIVAYEEASKIDNKIKIDYQYTGVLVSLVYGYSLSGLKADDIITHVDNVEIENLNHFRELNAEIKDDKYFKLTIIRNNSKIELNTKKVFDEENKVYVLGINVMDYYTINSDKTFPKFEFNENYNYNSIGGSGGAMLSLAIYNSLLEEDVTKNKIIIGTGTISIDGSIGDIGGVSQKIVTAKLYNADVFFCNPEDYEEAKTKASEIKAKFPVVEVKQFSDIINYLKGEFNE